MNFNPKWTEKLVPSAAVSAVADSPAWTESATERNGPETERFHRKNDQSWLAPRVAGAPRTQWWWPDTEEGQIAAARMAAGALVFSGIVTASIALLNLNGVATGYPQFNAWSIIDVVICFSLAVWLCRMSRVAALTSVAYQAVNIAVFINHNQFGFIQVVWLLLFINAVRATFSYQRQMRVELHQEQVAAAIGDEPALWCQKG